MLRHELTECRPLVASAREIAAEHGFSDWLAIAEILDGWSQASAGDARGVVIIRSGLARYVAIQAGLLLPLFHALVADGELSSNAPDAALDAVRLGIAVAERNEESLYLPELHRLHGEILLRSNGAAAVSEATAEACFEQAIELDRRQSACSWELRATLSLARLWAANGRRAEAAARLSAIYGRFSEGHETTDLRAAAHLLAQLA